MTDEEEATVRAELSARYGETWDTQELQRDFTVIGFSYGSCAVQRKSDGAYGGLEFTHYPRFYYHFLADGK